MPTKTATKKYCLHEHQVVLINAIDKDGKTFVLVLLVHVVGHLLLPPVFEKKEFHGVAMILTKFADFIYLFSLY